MASTPKAATPATPATPAASKLHPKLAKYSKFIEQKLDLDGARVTAKLTMDSINTGSTVLNMLIGGSKLQDGSFVCPGWPRGSIVEIFGKESSGKSTVALMACAQVAAAGGAGLYVDLEHAVKDNYAIKLGCDFRLPEAGGSGNMMRIAPNLAEEAIEFVNGAALAGIDIIVVDSVAGLVPRKAAARNVADEDDKKQIGEVARLMSEWLPKLQSIIAKTRTCVIFLNQIRDKIGGFGYSEDSKTTTTGGNALKFWASIRMSLKPKMSTVATVFNPILKENEKVPISTDIEVKNIKNKIDARQGHTGLITIRYGTGIDEMRTILNVAEAYGIVKKTKNKSKQEVFLFESAETGKKIEIVGSEKFRTALRRDKGMFVELQGLAVEKILSFNKPIEDDALAELAENAIATSIASDDDDEMFSMDSGKEEKEEKVDYEDVEDMSLSDLK